MAPSWVISKSRNVVAKLVPDHVNKRYDIEIHSGVSGADVAEAEQGTVRDGRLVHPMNPERSGVEIKTIRGDYRDAEGIYHNRLRLWEISDFMPRPDDIWQERLYCIHWIVKETLGKSRQETFFTSVGDEDIAREEKVVATVRQNLALWQAGGLVPDMPIDPGDNTTQPIRERGWTHWHHLFCARQLLLHATYNAQRSNPELLLGWVSALDWNSKLCRWYSTWDKPEQTFYNQALNTLANYGSRASTFDKMARFPSYSYDGEIAFAEVFCHDARDVHRNSDVIITDPPYADAVNYHEITEFFIAWLRKNPPPPFDQWTWDSQRKLAIKGKDEEFRRDMVAAYSAMTRHMPDNGIQVVMFTHQDAGVWADLAAILWAAGLRVTAAWNIVTETESALKEGNYIQGTVCLVLRKRLDEANARRMEIEAEIEDAVRAQLDRLSLLDEAWTAETLYTDGDLTLAAYAAALQVVTSYSTIDRQPLDRDLYRKLAKN